jgi:hypothetical protein
MNQASHPNLLEELLEDIVEELDVPTSLYEAADRAYTSVGRWLERPGSALVSLRPVVHVQGSFALGTATKPATDEDEYDVDAVCELTGSKAVFTQQKLKDLLGHELRLYAQAHSMQNPPERRTRCWTLNYADEAQFHLDVLPALKDGQTAAAVYAAHGISNPYAATSIAITDESHPQFRVITNLWPRSNPRGYAQWFRLRQRTIFEERRAKVAARTQAKVEQIPDYKVKTPLQAAIQILKRHRDMWGQENPNRGPISIILTTLAAHAYQQEPTIFSALARILNDMDRFIERRNGQTWIANPSDPLENFADKWIGNPDLAVGFHEWLAAAREDFFAASRAASREFLIQRLAASLGDRLVRVAAKKRVAPAGIVSKLSTTLRLIFSAPHRQAPPWTVALSGQVKISEVSVKTDGFRPKRVSSDGPALPKNSSLEFLARTDIPQPYRVYWQVVNTGGEATRANCLRGNFEDPQPQRGHLTRTESTLYSGSHSIECFIVRNGVLLARSDPFIINIK